MPPSKAGKKGRRLPNRTGLSIPPGKNTASCSCHAPAPKTDVDFPIPFYANALKAVINKVNPARKIYPLTLTIHIGLSDVSPGGMIRNLAIREAREG
jgi:hypothetical protein